MSNKKLTINDIFNIESKKSWWEITNHKGFDENDETLTIHYVPEDDYSNKDVKIKIPIEHFYDLVELIKKIKK
jgi:hypothetical protein